MSMTAIATQALTKVYGGGRRGPTVRALDDLTVEVREGEIIQGDEGVIE